MAGPRHRSQRRTPRQERARELVDALLEATARVVAGRGPDGVTVNEIVRVAGVSPGSAYQYFGSKDELLGALVERKAERDLVELAGASPRPGRSPTCSATAPTRSSRCTGATGR